MKRLKVTFKVAGKEKSGIIRDKIRVSDPNGYGNITKYMIEQLPEGKFHIVSPHHIIKLD